MGLNDDLAKIYRNQRSPSLKLAVSPEEGSCRNFLNFDGHTGHHEIGGLCLGKADLGIKPEEGLAMTYTQKKPHPFPSRTTMLRLGFGAVLGLAAMSCSQGENTVTCTLSSPVGGQQFVVELSSSELSIKERDDGGEGSTTLSRVPDRPLISSFGAGDNGGVVVAIVEAEEEAPTIVGSEPFPIESGCSLEVDGNLATAQGVSVDDTILVSWKGTDFPAPISESGFMTQMGG